VRVPEPVVTRKVGDETVILSLESGMYYGLDPVGSRFIELLETGASLESVIDRMSGEYAVSDEQLEADLLKLSEEMLANGLLETD
jgi:hypothetical protein